MLRALLLYTLLLFAFPVLSTLWTYCRSGFFLLPSPLLFVVLKETDSYVRIHVNRKEGSEHHIQESWCSQAWCINTVVSYSPSRNFCACSVLALAKAASVKSCTDTYIALRIKFLKPVKVPAESHYCKMHLYLYSTFSTGISWIAQFRPVSLLNRRN